LKNLQLASGKLVIQMMDQVRSWYCFCYRHRKLELTLKRQNNNQSESLVLMKFWIAYQSLAASLQRGWSKLLQP